MRDLACHEGLAAARALVVEQHAFAGVYPVRLAAILDDLLGIELGHTAGVAWVEGCALAPKDLLHQAIGVASADLIEARLGRLSCRSCQAALAARCTLGRWCQSRRCNSGRGGASIHSDLG